MMAWWRERGRVIMPHSRSGEVAAHFIAEVIRVFRHSPCDFNRVDNVDDLILTPTISNSLSDTFASTVTCIALPTSSVGASYVNYAFG
jgi:hypothetical protein